MGYYYGVKYAVIKISGPFSTCTSPPIETGHPKEKCSMSRPINIGSSLVSPKRVVGCRAGSQYVEVCWGFPYLKIKKCLGFLFVGFLVFGLLVLWSLGSKVSKFRRMTKLPFHAFDRYPISKIFKFLFTGYRLCRRPLQHSMIR